MKIRVRLFAAARQAAGRDTIDVELPDGATVAALRRQLAGQLPALSRLLAAAMFAVNLKYADDQTAIPPDAEVACIPPVSGG